MRPGLYWLPSQFEGADRGARISRHERRDPPADPESTPRGCGATHPYGTGKPSTSLQSTPPIQGATPSSSRKRRFNPRPARATPAPNDIATSRPSPSRTTSSDAVEDRDLSRQTIHVDVDDVIAKGPRRRQLPGARLPKVDGLSIDDARNAHPLEQPMRRRIAERTRMSEHDEPPSRHLAPRGRAVVVPHALEGFPQEIQIRFGEPGPLALIAGEWRRHVPMRTVEPVGAVEGDDIARRIVPRERCGSSPPRARRTGRHTRAPTVHGPLSAPSPDARELVRMNRPIVPIRGDRRIQIS